MSPRMFNSTFQPRHARLALERKESVVLQRKRATLDDGDEHDPPAHTNR